MHDPLLDCMDAYFNWRDAETGELWPYPKFNDSDDRGAES